VAPCLHMEQPLSGESARAQSHHLSAVYSAAREGRCNRSRQVQMDQFGAGTQTSHRRSTPEWYSVMIPAKVRTAGTAGRCCQSRQRASASRRIRRHPRTGQHRMGEVRGIHVEGAVTRRVDCDRLLLCDGKAEPLHHRMDRNDECAMVG
jgi:hypothetical protein